MKTNYHIFKFSNWLFVAVLTFNFQLSTFNCFAQTNSCIAIGGALSESCISIIQSTDGGYVMAGNTSSYGAGLTDVYVVKLNSSGTVVWDRTMGGTGDELVYPANGNQIVQTTDGGYAVSAITFDGTIWVTPSKVYVVKLDASGTALWNRTVYNTFEDAFSIAKTSDGNLVVAAQMHTGSVWSGYVVKMNNSGTVLWTTRINNSSINQSIVGITQTTDGGCFGVGQYRAGATSDFYAVKLTSSGALQWTSIISGANREMACSAVQSTDGGYVMAGYTNSYGQGGDDVYVVKLNSSGNIVWTRTVGGTGDEQGYSIIQTTDGGYAVAGYTSSYGAGGSDAYVVKLTSSGALQWTRTFGGTGSDIGYSIINTADGGYAVGGSTSSFGNGSTDFYFIKLASDGSNTCCTTGSGGIASSGGVKSSSGTSSSGGISGTRGVSGTGGGISVLQTCFVPVPIELLSFDATAENNTLVRCEWSTATEINNDYFAIEHSKDGNTFAQIGTVKGAPGGNSSAGLNYEFYDHDPYSGISYYRLKQVDFDGTYTYSPIRAVYIGTINLISIYPNPATDYIQYEVGSEAGGAVTITLYDALGREIYNKEETIGAGLFKERVETQNFASGNYLLRITNGNKEKTQKQFVIK